MYILFGYGAYAKQAVELLGKEAVRYFVDNDETKRNITAKIPIYTFSEKEKELHETTDTIMLSVSYQYENEIAKQLESHGISNYVRFSQYRAGQIRKKIAQRTDFLAVYKKAIRWIKKNTVPGKGIISADMKNPYPEVSGYYIPSLLYWGERDLALSYARWLCSIQKEDGSWYDKDDEKPFIFDTAQILKGLISVRDFFPEADKYIRRGCEWMISHMEESGQLPAVADVWGDGKTMSELIHIYCLSPLRDAGIIYDEKRYAVAAERSLSYYLRHYLKDILQFHLLSHFYAYVMEGLIDIGRADIARQAMINLEAYQKEDGSVPGYNNVSWVCSTGLFQLALVWFRLGNIERGNKAFEYACKLQNESGGWFGSYLHADSPNEECKYLPNTEISWAVKYFLDALRYKAVASFEAWNPGTYWDSISKEDKKYILIKRTIENHVTHLASNRILEVGCYHGRYLRNLLEDLPSNQYYAVDISEKTLRAFDDILVEKKCGALTCIPYLDNSFDVVYACEALEHAVDIENSIREVARVLKPGGVMLFIDKNVETLGVYEIEDWEQWFDEQKLATLLQIYCDKVDVFHNVDALVNDKKDVFSAWIGIRK